MHPLRKWGKNLGWIAAWVWTVAAAGGGLMLLWEKGPLPLTNGWFALLSGISACPLTAWPLKTYAGVTVSGRVQFAAALAFGSRGGLRWRTGTIPFLDSWRNILNLSIV